MVPAAGQAAVAIQTRLADAGKFAPLLDADASRAVTIERRFLARLGEGCHTAFASHWTDDKIHLFRDDFGRHTYDFPANLDAVELDAMVDAVLKKLS
jgi:hydroxymethylbilane synthase